jgi:DNA-binding Lrp family transcriptional regulator
MKLSAIIDKMGLKISNPKATQEEVGADLLIQVVSKAYKAEKEIYNFIAEVKKISVKEAEEVEIVEFIKEMNEINGLKSFFTSAVK